MHGDVMGIVHTEVPMAAEGRGIAGQVVRAALAHAREQGLRVAPMCSYVRAYMQRHPETHDLLPAGTRSDPAQPRAVGILRRRAASPKRAGAARFRSRRASANAARPRWGATRAATPCPPASAAPCRCSSPLPTPARNPRRTVKRRFRGCLLGGAVGDALGAPGRVHVAGRDPRAVRPARHHRVHDRRSIARARSPTTRR